MPTRIQKWGNSLALRIPKSFAEQARLSEGTDVDLVIEGERLIVRAVRAPKHTLDRLLAGITKRNLHREVDTGESLGLERL